MAALSRHVRAAAPERTLVLVGENEPQHSRLSEPLESGGFGLDGLWNDDFHHAAMVALVGRSEAYYSDYRGHPQEFISAFKYGFLFQGQRHDWQRKRRGTPCRRLRPAAFVSYLQNHDQVANSGRGQRCQFMSHPGSMRAMTALWLLGPHTPMLFQGQEFGSSSPFYFFADHHADLAAQVRTGRQRFLSQFPTCTDPRLASILPDPADPQTFEVCKLRFSQRQENAESYQLHRDLLRLRRGDPTIRASRRPGGLDGAVLGEAAFVLRFFAHDDGPAGEGDRLMLVNFGRDLHISPAPEPLLAPPQYHVWELMWSSEDPTYGGCGTPPLETDTNWRLPGHAAFLMRPGVPAPAGDLEP
jgi:maltooligosyltrehalose trehalohydrolase